MIEFVSQVIDLNTRVIIPPTYTQEAKRSHFNTMRKWVNILTRLTLTFEDPVILCIHYGNMHASAC